MDESTVDPGTSLLDAARSLAFPLTGRQKTVLGRGRDCDFVLADARVSRLHATIEVVEGNSLLRDEGSSNGTFLNGLRLTPGTTFSLREGDVIEVGSHRFVFGCATSAPANEPEARASAFPVDELVRDGYAQLDIMERRQIQVTIQRAFDAVTRIAGIERCLAAAREILNVSCIGFFAQDAGGHVRTIAAVPSIHAVSALSTLAQVSWTGREARLLHGASLCESRPSGDTFVQAFETSAAVPILAGEQLLAVLAVARFGSRILDRKDLGLLAVIGARIAVALSVQGKSPQDTRSGFGEQAATQPLRSVAVELHRTT